MEKTIALTEDEAEMLETYLFRKQINLENSNLTDAKCYPLICSIRKNCEKSVYRTNKTRYNYNRKRQGAEYYDSH